MDRIGYLVLWSMLVLCNWTDRASACSIVPFPDRFGRATPETADRTPPSAPELIDIEIKRSMHAPPGSGDCGEVGNITLSFRLSDAQTWPENMGLRLHLYAGKIPPKFQIPDYALITDDGTVSFSQGDYPDQAIDFTLQAFAVDGYGNESEPTEVHVTDSGRNSESSVNESEPTEVHVTDSGRNSESSVNESEPTEVHVTDSGRKSEGSGCSIAARNTENSSLGQVAIWIAALAGIALRRRGSTTGQPNEKPNANPNGVKKVKYANIRKYKP